MSQAALYSGSVVALGTMHDKHIAIGKPFALRLGAELHVPLGLDTDCYGTFTGEVERYGTMLEAARAKAELAIEKTGLCYGLGSEGTFGPHPYLPDTASNTELLVFVDRKRNLVIREALITQRTNYGWFPADPAGDWRPGLDNLKFPSHAVAVMPNAQVGEFAPIKGIRDYACLERAVTAAGKHSFDGAALISSDMRAHMNPTRMAVIRVLAHRLALRIRSTCDECGAPGFGLADLARGLPCAACQTLTPIARAEIHRCACCNFEKLIPFRAGKSVAPPSECPRCQSAGNL